MSLLALFFPPGVGGREGGRVSGRVGAGEEKKTLHQLWNSDYSLFENLPEEYCLFPTLSLDSHLRRVEELEQVLGCVCPPPSPRWSNDETVISTQPAALAWHVCMSGLSVSRHLPRISLMRWINYLCIHLSVTSPLSWEQMSVHSRQWQGKLAVRDLIVRLLERKRSHGI